MIDACRISFSRYKEMKEKTVMVIIISMIIIIILLLLSILTKILSINGMDVVFSKKI